MIRKTNENIPHNNTDLMIDIESFGTKKDKIILSLAAVFFNINTGKIGRHFQRKINMNQSLHEGFTIDGKTLSWWLDQDPKLLKKIINPEYSDYPNDAMHDFIEFCDEYGSMEGYNVWARPPLYDLRALYDAFDKYNLTEPWHFQNIRCVRTYASIFPGIEKEFPAQGDEHDPSVDCERQIKYVSEIHKRIKKMKSDSD